MGSSNFYKIVDSIHVCLVIMSDWEVLPVNLGFGKTSEMIFESVEMKPEIGIEDVVVVEEGWFGVSQEGG